MEYRLLEANGVENENNDGAAMNNMSARGESGVIPGVLNECDVYLSGSSEVVVSTGELIIHGFRVKITSPYTVQRTASASTVTHHIVARVTLSSDRSVQFQMECRVAATLTQEFILQKEQGVYELEIARFSTDLNGVSNLQKTVRVVGLMKYTLTEEDKQAIVQQVINSFPVYSGEVELA